jgi:hypothetical protein
MRAMISLYFLEFPQKLCHVVFIFMRIEILNNFNISNIFFGKPGFGFLLMSVKVFRERYEGQVGVMEIPLRSKTP